MARKSKQPHLTIGDPPKVDIRWRGSRDKMRSINGFLYLAFSCAIEAMVLRFGLPKEVDPSLAGRILGGIDTGALLVLTFYFGASQGSEEKTNIMARAIPRQPPDGGDE